MDIISSIDSGVKSISERPKQVQNGFRTLAPLIEAAIRRDVDDIEVVLNDSLSHIKQLSEALFTELGAIEDADKPLVRSVVLSFVKQLYETEQETNLTLVAQVGLLKRMLQDNSVSAEAGEDAYHPLFFAKVRFSCQLAALFAKQSETHSITTKVRQHTRTALLCISKECKRVAGFSFSEEHLKQVEYAVLEDSCAIYAAIYQTELEALQMQQRGGKDISNIDLDSVVQRQFEITLKATLDAVMVSSDFS